MRICIIGHYEKYRNEGGRNIAYSIADELSKRHDIIRLHVWDISLWKKIKSFNPEIIHYIPDTLLAFALPRILSYPFQRKAKTVLSAHHLPAFQPNSWFFKKLMPLLKPDLTLVQSLESEQILRKLGFKTHFIGNGVDVNRFVPVAMDVKDRLREKYKLDKEKFIILHVGPIRRRRGLQILELIQREDKGNQVLIVGRSGRSMPIESEVYKNLVKSGCIIWTDYFHNIEEIYALSDCYIFPVTDKLASIEVPLSVLEAMSCNLPVISTKFGGLTRMFDEGEGLLFADTKEDFISKLQEIKAGNAKVETRKKVLPYSWESIAIQIEKIYESLLR